MPIRDEQKTAAQTVQHAAAHDQSPQVRLLAGPGTGKSSSIEERVHWLLTDGVAPGKIVAVSFTRAAAKDLEERIYKYGEDHGHTDVRKVRVSTLHSVALRVLRVAGLLTAFPADPRVLDNWELENIFDTEFGVRAPNSTKRRREEIRRAHEAFWSTGVWAPPNYTPPTPPVSEEERQLFTAFLTSRGQLYSCVLPGEIVRKCVDHAAAGTLDLGELVAASHLIVDEYQDLNPCDLEFIRLIASTGVRLFVAGDDDQSIYSFRFASPAGLQTFCQQYPTASAHSLSDCFRCAPAVLNAAYALVAAYADPNRLAKEIQSLYVQSAPPVSGSVHRWRFSTSDGEDRAIAESCRDLIAAGVSADKIMILLSSVPTLGRGITDALEQAGVPFRAPRPKPLSDLPEGRFVLALLRTAFDSADYVARRTILGLLRRVGPATCSGLADTVHTGNLNYRDIFTGTLPTGAFGANLLRALNRARAVVAQVQDWTLEDTLTMRREAVKTLVNEGLGNDCLVNWSELSDSLPDEMTLAELQVWLGASAESDRQRILVRVAARCGNPDVQEEIVQPAVQLMRLFRISCG